MAGHGYDLSCGYMGTLKTFTVRMADSGLQCYHYTKLRIVSVRWLALLLHV